MHTAVTCARNQRNTCDKKDGNNHSLGNNLFGDYLGRKSPTEYILLVFHHDHPNPIYILDENVTLSLGTGNREPSLRKDTCQKMKDEKNDRFQSSRNKDAELNLNRKVIVKS